MPKEWLISVDDHLIEPGDVWTKDAPREFADRVPRLTESDRSGLVWEYEDLRMPIDKTILQAGQRPDQIVMGGARRDEMLDSYWQPKARLQAMDEDNVLASLCFPYFPRFCGQTFYEAKDRDLALWCVQRYNDWVLEEWCGPSEGRLLAMIILPLWDPMLAAREIERCAARGAKAITFSENPTKLGLPSIHTSYWDPMFQAASDTGLPLAIHFGSSSSLPTTSDDAPMLVPGVLGPLNLAFAFTDWMFSGVLDRYPKLKVLFAEGGIGWIPYLLERCENIIRDQSWMTQTDLGETEHLKLFKAIGLKKPMERSPRQIFKDQMYGCFIDDAFGCRNLEEIGIDNVLIETDYPHGDGTFPNSLQNAKEHLGHYSADIRAKVLRQNAAKLFDLPFADELLAPVEW